MHLVDRLASGQIIEQSPNVVFRDSSPRLWAEAAPDELGVSGAGDHSLRCTDLRRLKHSESIEKKHPDFFERVLFLWFRFLFFEEIDTRRTEEGVGIADDEIRCRGHGESGEDAVHHGADEIRRAE
jgi:hypothetical protein